MKVLPGFATFVIGIALAPLLGGATHDPNCVMTSADPASYTQYYENGEYYYIEVRTTGPGAGRTYYYREMNYAGASPYTLERGGTGFLGDPQDTDPINDETCGHGPDHIITSTATAVNGAYPFVAAIRQETPNGVPTMPFPMPDCTFSASPGQATLTCTPATLGNFWCEDPVVASFSGAGTVKGKSACDGGPAAFANATVLAPLVIQDATGQGGFPWRCEAEFPAGAVGQVGCWTPKN